LTSEFGEQQWSNFADAWAACKSIGANCGSIGQEFDHYYLRKGTTLSASGDFANFSHGGCWLKISDTRSTYCNDVSSAGTSPGK